MANQQDLIDSATTLSTAADGLSTHAGDLADKAKAVVAALQNADLSPAATAALAAMQNSITNTQASTAKVDAEVSELDGLLPSPAPAGAAAVKR